MNEVVKRSTASGGSMKVLIGVLLVVFVGLMVCLMGGVTIPVNELANWLRS